MQQVTPKVQPFTVVILAGGQSSRMGQDKALLSVPTDGQDNIDLLTHMSHIATDAGAQQVLINRNEDDFCLQDEYPGAGPLAGFHAALKKLPQDSAILFIAVDMPLLTANLLTTLVSEGELRQQAVYFQEQMLPLYLHNNSDYLAYLTQVLEQHGNISIRAFLKHIQAQAINCSEPDKLISANTPENWAYCCSKLVD